MNADRELIEALGDDIRDYVATVIDRSQIITDKGKAKRIGRLCEQLVIDELEEEIKLA